MKTADQTISKLKDKIKGTIVLPTDSNYDEVRTIWNAMIDRRPAVIVQCATAADVPPAIAFARENDLAISIRGAGHNIAGNCLCDNGLLIDFSNMKQVKVDVARKRATVEPGATLADFDAATQAHGLATPVGINSTTGIAGLTLGGGFGWLTRKYGLTIDNLVSANVVTAEGKIVKASATEHPDLFWAIRGGGGNFGVVTEFEFQLYKVGPEITAGLLVFPAAQAKQILQRYREFVKSSPVEMCVWVVMRKAPPLPFLPAEVHGTDVLVLAFGYNGATGGADKMIATLRGFGDPAGEFVGPMPYVNWQQAFDPLLTPGARNYWKSHNFTELKDEVFDAMIKYALTVPDPQCEIFIAHIDGAGNKIAPDATAWVNRDAKFVMNVHGRWADAAQDKKCIGWARDFFAAAKPFASAGAYVNFMTDDEADRVESAYGANYARLAKIKSQYDPKNVFHVNHNIKTK